MNVILKDSNNQSKTMIEIIIIVVLSTIKVFGIIVLEILLLNFIMQFIFTPEIGSLLNQAIEGVCLLLLIFIFLKKIDKKSFSDIGFSSIRKFYKEFIFGILLGSISMTLIFAILLITNSVEITNFSSLNVGTSAFNGLIIFTIVGIKEELLSRGYFITSLNETQKPWFAVIISSLVFSSLHVFNPNVKILGFINILFAGILLGYMYIKTKNLWMPIGFHITWNYFQGCIYGFYVSGLDIQGVFRLSISKNSILSGGAFGPEAGILATIILILDILIVWKVSYF